VKRWRLEMTETVEDRLEVMVVDDEEIVRKRLKTALQNYGYAVEVFPSGESAIERLQVKQFDVVVTDIRMGEVDGSDVLDAVGKYAPQAKTIMITGYASMETARETLLKGAFDFIAKPFRPSELRQIIEKARRELKGS
jgi:DNA-binding NtrC family response regulator